MSGLGIVLEEDPSVSLAAYSEAAVVPPDHNPENEEQLLPPLPEDDLDSPSPPGMLKPALHPVVLSPSLASLAHADSTNSFAEELPSDRFLVPSELLDFDSLALIDATPVPFPLLLLAPDLARSALAAALADPLGALAPGNTSPLRRLRSLKNTIRKLSLLVMGPLAPPTPDLGPGSHLHASFTAADHSPHDGCLLSSADESVRLSTFSLAHVLLANLHTPFAAHAAQGPPVCSPVTPSHAHTLSLGLGGSKSRRRTISRTDLALLATPPLPSPIVTVTDDLLLTMQNLAAADQRFFGSWPGGDGLAPPLALQSHELVLVRPTPADIDAMLMLTSPDDLMDYLLYLKEHKKTVKLAYEVSENRLLTSGWCSGNELDNLAMQKDTFLSKIDSKLLRVEARLNAEFNMSSASTPSSRRPRADYSAPALSPSLKDLELRCLVGASDGRALDFGSSMRPAQGGV